MIKKPRTNPVYCGIDTTDLGRGRQADPIHRRGGRSLLWGGIKIGLEFFLAHGAPGVRYAFPMPVRGDGGVGFFLDLKLHDIPNTAGRRHPRG